MELSEHGNTIVVPAQPDSVRVVRKTLARELSDRQVDSESTFNVLLVASELIANAIEHGSRPGDEVALAYTIGSKQFNSLCATTRDEAERRQRSPPTQNARTAAASTWSSESQAGRNGS